MKKLVAAIALAFSAFTASADLVNVGPVVNGSLVLNGFEHTPVSAGVQVSPLNAFGVSAGGVKATFNSVEEYIVYCVELFSPATLHTANAYNFGLAANAPVVEISKVLTLNGGTSTTDSLKSAGVQLAIWELLYDVNPISVSSGNFTATTSASNIGAINYANWLLSGIPNASADYEVLLFTDNADGKTNRQDFITAKHKVDEPGGLALAGLGLLGFFLRKKKSRLDHSA